MLKLYWPPPSLRAQITGQTLLLHLPTTDGASLMLLPLTEATGFVVRTEMDGATLCRRHGELLEPLAHFESRHAATQALNKIARTLIRPPLAQPGQALRLVLLVLLLVLAAALLMDWAPGAGDADLAAPAIPAPVEAPAAGQRPGMPVPADQFLLPPAGE